MEFESLQAIWDTQNETPVFAMQDPRLVVALYQQREHSRRRTYKLQFAPMYGAAMLMFVVIGALIATFLSIASLMRRFPGKITHNGFALSGWDYAGLVVAAVALLAIVVPMYFERKKHERTQQIFAPSLREELDRGIAQLDFAMGLDSIPRVTRILSLLSIAVVLINWEAQRAVGNPRPWWTLLWAVLVFVPGALGWIGSRKARKSGTTDRARKLEHRRALESMRAALDEDASGSTNYQLTGKDHYV